MSQTATSPPSTAAATLTSGQILWQKVNSYIALTKPRIIELLLVTTVPAMILAKGGWPGLGLVLHTLVAGTLSAGAANTFNSYLDRDIDAVMQRTKKRPLVVGSVSTRGALILAWALTVISTLYFYFVVGSPLATWFSLAAIFSYVVVYTMWLKRRTSQNIVWGGAAGCMPVLIGWAAVTESVAWTPFVLFLIIFFWTPPHYWPLSLRFRNDYARAEVPMLGVVASERRVALEMIWYAVAMVATTLILVPVAGMTWLYGGLALAAGLWFVLGCVRLFQKTQQRGLWDYEHNSEAANSATAVNNEVRPNLGEMKLFRDSIVYLTLVFAAIMVDPFLPDSWQIWQI